MIVSVNDDCAKAVLIGGAYYQGVRTLRELFLWLSERGNTKTMLWALCNPSRAQMLLIGQEQMFEELQNA